MSVGVLGETAAAILAQARILGLLGGAGDLAVGAFEVRRYGRLVRGAGHRGAVVLLLCCVAGSLGAPAGARPAPKREAHLLRAYRPLLRFDRSERELPAGIEALVHSARLVRGSGRVVAASPARGVPALTPEFLGPRYPKGAGRADPDDRIVGTDAGLGRPPKPLVHGRLVRRAQGGAWLQYWLFYRDNPQDRGVLHTGRHQGDWELVQVRLDRRDRPERTTLRAHLGAGMRAEPGPADRLGHPDRVRGQRLARQLLAPRRPRPPVARSERPRRRPRPRVASAGEAYR